MGEIKPIIGLEEGWNIKIKAAALDKLEVCFKQYVVDKSDLYDSGNF